jgi:hypothetical protein
VTNANQNSNTHIQERSLKKCFQKQNINQQGTMADHTHKIMQEIGQQH